MFVCVLCGWDDPREVDGWLPGVGGVCLEHALEAWQLCAVCRYWVATVGPLCDACATDRTKQHGAHP